MRNGVREAAAEDKRRDHRGNGDESELNVAPDERPELDHEAENEQKEPGDDSNLPPSATRTNHRPRGKDPRVT